MVCSGSHLPPTVNCWSRLVGVQRWVLCEMISQFPKQGAYILSFLTQLYHTLRVDPQGSANLLASLITEAVE